MAFKSLDSVACTLWALFLGDEVNNTYRQTEAVSRTAGLLFMTAYTSIFFLMIANVFIFCVEKGLLSAEFLLRSTLEREEALQGAGGGGGGGGGGGAAEEEPSWDPRASGSGNSSVSRSYR